MVFVVGEIGVNWDGNFELVREMILNAKESGCNAVKFQAYKKEMVQEHPESSRLFKSVISNENVKMINDIANEIGIEWFCTPMYPEAVDFLTPYVKKFKIREFDGRELLLNKSTPLFEKVLATKKEVIISSNNSPRNCDFFNNSQIKWLYCVPKYPTDFEDLDFGNLSDYDVYSNHCPHFLAPLTAAVLGSDIIEIHITSDKTKDFVDNNVSFDYKELKELINLIRSTEKIKK